jgi:pimeloyl-ACP methyl ester carboxylesterase
VPDYKILHDAGYNVLAYDLRNHGLSSAANGGVVTHGFTESRDVAGSLVWDGYLEFQRRPQPMLDWFAQYF